MSLPKTLFVTEHMFENCNCTSTRKMQLFNTQGIVGPSRPSELFILGATEQKLDLLENLKTSTVLFCFSFSI